MENKKSNTKDRELFISRTFNAPVELVWEMFTDPEHIANWWGPDGFTNTIAEMNVIPGGKWDFIMHGPDGTNYDNKSIFREIIKNKRLVFDHVSEPKIVFTIDFIAQGEKTLLNWHMLFESAEQLMEVARKNGAVEGLKQNIDKLELYLANMHTRSN
ncbi:MAG TPA: SRPBCC family protein [Flavipsychrobacter sp.]|nr:SRPBCC family protein [Flavipsychrobacter sp.]